jgi:hypothetical protein
MQSRSTLAALSVAHGRFEADRARERDVAEAIASSVARRGQKQSFGVIVDGCD